MRGAHPDDHQHHSGMRIIPAYAGSTHEGYKPIGAYQDHPRVCGEHGKVGALTSKISGSSPRMRGAHIVNESGLYKIGIIPAYAGSTGAK